MQVPENLLQLYVENSPLALITFDSEFRVTAWSERAATMFGWSEREMVGTSLGTCGFMDADEGVTVRSVFEPLARGPVNWGTNVNRNVRRDGTILHCRWFNAYLKSEAFTGYISLAEDITASVHAEARAAADQERSLARIEESEERFRSIFDNNPDPMIAFDADATVSRANAAAGRVLEIDPDALVGATLGDVAGDDHFAEALAAFNRALVGLAGGVELDVRHARAGTIPAFVTMIPIRFRGVAAGVHLHVRDLRATRAQQRQIETHAERIRELYVSAAGANENADLQITSTIEAGCRILGLGSGALYESASDRVIESFGEPIGSGLARLALAADRALAVDDVRGLPQFASDPDPLPFVAFVGTPIDVGGTAFGSLCFAGRNRRAAFDDVDRDLVQLMGALVGSAIERGRSRKRLQTLAYNDTVTALPNRAWLVDRLRAMLDAARQDESTIGVLFLDLDRFKDINDTLGHAAGDRLLRIVGERLSRAIRASDVVARMGGDEFVVLSGDAADSKELSALAERITTIVEEPVELDGAEYFVTTSIGIASFPADGPDAETLIKHADVAMYRAKDRGRNTYQFFTPALNAALHTRLSQEKTLRKALDNDEFVVYYQPQHDLVTGRITAVEALVRWNHPRSGIVLPGQFIPNAELSGLIVQLGDFILETACRDIGAMRRTIAPGLRLCVNLSARQFHQQRLAAKVRECVERTGFDATALELEITESVAMNDAALTVSIMRDLGAEGMSLAVDDFGTGYSSLGYLRRFPLDAIKIDRSFVTDLAREPEDATIVRTVIAMAHALDLEVIAEGVETAEQLAFLRSERCDRVQGFYFSQGVPLASLETYIIQGTTAATAGY